MDTVTNHYSRLIHAQMVDGKAYGFAFDDVGEHEALVHDGNPQRRTSRSIPSTNPTQEHYPRPPRVPAAARAGPGVSSALSTPALDASLG